MSRKIEVRYVNLYSAYTAGSAAYQFDPEPIRQKKEVVLPKPRRQKKIVVRMDPVAVLGICMAIVLLISMTVGLFQLGAAKKEAQQMQNYVNTLTQRNEELTATYEQGYDPEEIYQIAIALGMIPAEQAQHVQLRTEAPVLEEQTPVRESFWASLAGLFA